MMIERLLSLLLI